MAICRNTSRILRLSNKQLKRVRGAIRQGAFAAITRYLSPPPPLNNRLTLKEDSWRSIWGETKFVWSSLLSIESCYRAPMPSLLPTNIGEGRGGGLLFFLMICPISPENDGCLGEGNWGLGRGGRRGVLEGPGVYMSEWIGTS